MRWMQNVSTIESSAASRANYRSMLRRRNLQTNFSSSRAHQCRGGRQRRAAQLVDCTRRVVESTQCAGVHRQRTRPLHAEPAFGIARDFDGYIGVGATGRLHVFDELARFLLEVGGRAEARRIE